jgi:NADH-quinone oxidoreductase subunit G
MNLINIEINGQKYSFDKAYTIIQACDIIGIEIPRFCYHKRLNIAGNCRMCLVKINTSIKPVASCAINIANNMIIDTMSDDVRNIRKSIMEFLLINHPLDCPVCDEGGECDLQDQAFKYGKGFSEFIDEKRIVEDKDFGVLIKTSMTRCIQCMRCVRFMDDVFGSAQLGTINRGENLEIVSSHKGKILSEVSANIIDLCPVGALTNKPYSHKARSWELSHIPSIDLTDSMGCNIFVDVKGSSVMRILPRENNAINEEWISDRARFHYDGLSLQRISKPYLKDRKTNKFSQISWLKALEILNTKLMLVDPKRTFAFVGPTQDFESIYMLKKIFQAIGCENIDFRSDDSYFPVQYPEICRFNTGFEGLEESDFCLIIGSNIRKSAPILNLRLRRLFVENNLDIFIIGPKYNLNYDYNHVSQSVNALEKIYYYDENDAINSDDDILLKFSNSLKSSVKPVIIIGDDIFKESREVVEYILYWIFKINEKYKNIIQFKFESSDDYLEKEKIVSWNGINCLSSDAHCGSSVLAEFFMKHERLGSANLLSQIYNNKEDSLFKKEIDLLFLLNFDNIDFSKINSDFTVYQGHSADVGCENADLILPSLSYVEKEAFYINMELRAQKAYKAVSISPIGARKDLHILLDIYNKITQNKEYLTEKDFYEKIYQDFSCLNHNNLGKFIFNKDFKYEEIFNKLSEYYLNNIKNLDFNFEIQHKKYNFFRTNSILKNSNLMKELEKIEEEIFN